MQWLKSEGIELVNLGGYSTNVLSPPWRNGLRPDLAELRRRRRAAAARGESAASARAASCAAPAPRALKLAAGGVEIEVEQPDGAKTFRAAARRHRRRRLPGQPRHGRASTSRRRRKSCCSATAAPRSATACAWRRRSAPRPSGGMDNFYGHLHSRDAMQTDQAVAAALVPTISRRPASSSTPSGRRVADEGLGGIWICPTPSPACPTRSAPRSSSIRRSGTARPAATTCSRPIRWCSRPAARCIAPTRSRSWPQ